MIYREGTIRLYSTGLVVGAGTRFKQEVPQGATLIISGIVGAFQIAEIINDIELKLSRCPPIPPSNWIDPVSYSISYDFTPLMQAPYPRRGEVDNNHLLIRALTIFDDALPIA